MANPNKIKVVLNMKFPTTAKKVQMLTWCINALRRFISRSVDEYVPFFKILKMKTCFGWNEGGKQAFQNLKEYLGGLLRMVSFAIREPLLAYVALSVHAVSAVLLVKRDKQ